MRGELRGIEEVVVDYSDDQQVKKSAASSSSSSTSGFFSSLKGLVGSKVLTKETIQPVMDKMQDHLIGN
jgi:signal recognition particle receptor subunit alpha